MTLCEYEFLVQYNREAPKGQHHYMAKLHLDTGELNLNNKSIILEGNAPLTDAYKEILKKYEVIYLSKEFNQSLGGLPRCIKAIRTNTNVAMYCKCGNRMTVNLEDFAFNQPIANLHDGLEYLELYGNSSQELRNLPASLKYLLLYKINPIHLEYLPESLEILYLYHFTLANEEQQHLPRGLKELYLHRGIDNPIHSLPEGLQVLYLNGNYTQLDKIYTPLDKSIKFPAGLQTFIFNDNQWITENKYIILWLFKNKKMPKSLKKCIFPLHYADIFCELKTYAKEYITNEIDWKLREIRPDSLVEHIKAMYE